MTRPKSDPFRDWLTMRCAERLGVQKIAGQVPCTSVTIYNWRNGGGVAHHLQSRVITLAAKDGVPLDIAHLAPRTDK